MSLYAKLQKAYKNHRLLSGLKKQLQEHAGPLFLHDTHFSRAVPKNPKLLIYDCVDLPLMHQRTSRARRKRHKYLRAFIDCNAFQVARKAKIITLTSPYYKNFLSHWLSNNSSFVLLRNFISKSNKSITPDQTITAKLKAHADVKHWLVIHNRIGEFLDIDGVLRALDKLPITWGLCFLGVMDGKNSQSNIKQRAAQFCSNHTVMCHDAIYGDEKLAALKCFDLGLVPLTLESQNLKRCIPNRSLEFLCVGVPQLTSRTRPLLDLSLEYPDNVFVPRTQKQKHFEDALQKACGKIEQGTKVSITSAIPDWSQDFGIFFDLLDDQVSKNGLKKELIILSENNPKKNNRLFNIQTALKKAGYSAMVLEIDLKNHQVIRHS